MSNTVLTDIKSRGYWQAIIRPERFVQNRISTFAECERLIESNQVRSRGWYFPHVHQANMYRGLDYIELATVFREIHETWRLYQSGQFIFYRGLSEDWIEADDWVKVSVAPGAKQSITSTLYQLSEIYEFAARLAQVGLFDGALVLKVSLLGSRGRSLFFWPDEGMRVLSGNYVCQISELTKQQTYSVADFIANSRAYSFQHFLWVMERFGFDASPVVFQRDQDKFFEGRY